MNACRPDAAIIWADLSKFGQDDFNHVTEAIRVLLQHMPSRSAAVVIVPLLPSAKVVAGLRGEVPRQS